MCPYLLFKPHAAETFRVACPGTDAGSEGGSPASSTRWSPRMPERLMKRHRVAHSVGREDRRGHRVTLGRPSEAWGQVEGSITLIDNRSGRRGEVTRAISSLARGDLDRRGGDGDLACLRHDGRASPRRTQVAYTTPQRRPFDAFPAARKRVAAPAGDWASSLARRGS
jgi:hypothetical protein